MEDGRIKDTGTSDIIKKKYPEIPVRNFPESILMPGLVNCHTHLEYSALGPLTKHVDFVPWIKGLIQKQKALSKAEILLSIRKTVKSLISAGVTSVGEVSRSGLSLDELIKSGIKGVYFNEFVAVDDNRLKKAICDHEANFRQCKLKLKRPDLKPGVFPHSPYTLSTKSLKYISSYYKKNKISCGMHAAESPFENEFIFKGSGPLADFVKTFQLESIPISGKWRGTTEYLNGLKFTDPLNHLVHCVHLNRKDFALLAKTKTGIVLCPRSNYLLKNGEFPLRSALKYDLKMGIGTDSLASNYSLDMFEEIRMLKNIYGSSLINERLVRIATLGGAEVLGSEKETGSLLPGKKADLIVVKINTRPVKNLSPVDHIVSKAVANDVCFTMIDGLIRFDK